ncbi:hypothetical protein PoMZ_05321 [Pyricularia oryzae]|uniref:Uncharacterized protein n=1 Tax=Pyricularia oryzae TaxID=318829 RepID=A0A4P7NMY5_PYROR|nr:hypothetical protein PoMZ_05321 [Pyricularia oryzae]
MRAWLGLIYFVRLNQVRGRNSAWAPTPGCSLAADIFGCIEETCDRPALCSTAEAQQATAVRKVVPITTTTTPPAQLLAFAFFVAANLMGYTIRKGQKIERYTILLETVIVPSSLYTTAAVPTRLARYWTEQQQGSLTFRDLFQAHPLPLEGSQQSYSNLFKG